MDRVLQFATFLKSIGMQLSKQDRVLNWFIQYQRDTQVQSQITSSTDLENLEEEYCEQIIAMFKNYPDLTVETCKNYLKLVFSKLLEKRVKDSKESN